MKCAIFLLLLLASPALALAFNADEKLADPALESRAYALGQMLRCVTCPMQTLNDSPAELAHDLRQLVRQQLLAGRSDAEIIDYLRQRYGDAILLAPPLQPATWLLWLGPIIFILLAGGGVAWHFSARARHGS